MKEANHKNLWKNPDKKRKKLFQAKTTAANKK